MCSKEFVPTSNRQIFCSDDCRQKDCKNKKAEARQEERGDHLYRKRICTVCGTEFWPNNSQQKFYSEKCQIYAIMK